MLKKLKILYRKYFPEEINFEGLYYDVKKGEYVALYFSPVSMLEFEIGRFNSLSEAKTAYDYYNKGIFDCKQYFNED